MKQQTDIYQVVEQAFSLLAQALDNEPASTSIRMDYAKLLIAEQQLDQAEQILKQTPVINIDRFYREKLARKSIVALFNMLGEDHKLVRQYRPRLLTVHAT